MFHQPLALSADTVADPAELKALEVAIRGATLERSIERSQLLARAAEARLLRTQRRVAAGIKSKVTTLPALGVVDKMRSRGSLPCVAVLQHPLRMSLGALMLTLTDLSVKCPVLRVLRTRSGRASRRTWCACTTAWPPSPPTWAS